MNGFTVSRLSKIGVVVLCIFVIMVSAYLSLRLFFSILGVIVVVAIAIKYHTSRRASSPRTSSPTEPSTTATKPAGRYTMHPQEKSHKTQFGRSASYADTSMPGRSDEYRHKYHRHQPARDARMQPRYKYGSGQEHMNPGPAWNKEMDYDYNRDEDLSSNPAEYRSYRTPPREYTISPSSRSNVPELSRVYMTDTIPPMRTRAEPQTHLEYTRSKPLPPQTNLQQTPPLYQTLPLYQTTPQQYVMSPQYQPIQPQYQPIQPIQPQYQPIQPQYQPIQQQYQPIQPIQQQYQPIQPIQQQPQLPVSQVIDSSINDIDTASTTSKKMAILNNLESYILTQLSAAMVK